MRNFAMARILPVPQLKVCSEFMSNFRRVSSDNASMLKKMICWREHWPSSVPKTGNTEFDYKISISSATGISTNCDVIMTQAYAHHYLTFLWLMASLIIIWRFLWLMASLIIIWRFFMTSLRLLSFDVFSLIHTNWYITWTWIIRFVLFSFY